MATATITSVEIRRATIADVPAIVAMGERFLRDVYADRMDAPNPAQIAATAHWMVDDEQRGAFVADDGGSVVGMIGVFMHPHPFTGQPTATEMCWWVNPNARGIGMQLLRVAERWATAQGATVLQMTAPNDVVARVYEHLGFQKVETSYTRRLPSMDTEAR